MKLFSQISDTIIAAVISVIFCILYLLIGTQDLESRLTTVYSLAKNTQNQESMLPNRVESFLQLPIYDYSLGLGTNLPLSAGLSRISVISFFINVSDNYFVALFLGILLFTAIISFLYCASLITVMSNFSKFALSTSLIFPFFVYTFLNDWPETAISYLSLMVIVSALTVVRIFQIEHLNIKNISFLLAFGLVVSLFGHYGYVPIIVLVILSHFMIYSKKFFKLGIALFKQKIILIIIVLYITVNLNLREVLISEKSTFNQSRITQQLIFSDSFFDLRQPNLLLLMLIIILVYYTRSQGFWKEIFLFVILTISVKFSGRFGIFAPSAEWWVRDFFWVIIIFKLISIQRIQVKRYAIRFTILFLFTLFNLLPVSIFFLNFSKSEAPSWTRIQHSPKSDYQMLLNRKLLMPGERLYTAPSTLVRNQGNGLSGLISYNDLTSNGITSISNWSKMRDSSLLARNSKMYENLAFSEDCTEFALSFLAVDVAIIGSELKTCREILIALNYKLEWSNEKFELYKGSPNNIYLVNPNVGSSELKTILEKRGCGIFESNCANSYFADFSEIKTLDSGGPFCNYHSKYRSWCLHFDVSSVEREIILPISFEKTLYTDSKVKISNLGGLLKLKVPPLYDQNIYIKYLPSSLDKIYWLNSVFASILLIYTQARIYLLVKQRKKQLVI